MTRSSFSLSYIAFLGTVLLAEIFSGFLVSLQVILLTPSSAVGIISSLTLYGGALVERIFNIDIGITDTLLALLFAPMAISLLVLCVFYSIVLMSPKGTYSLSDCLIAFGIFLLESMPFISGFLFWAVFAAYIRLR